MISRTVVYHAQSAEGIRIKKTLFSETRIKKPAHALVKVKACGVNPVDAKYCIGDKLPGWIPEKIKRLAIEGRGVGFDFSGEVLEAGTSSSFKTHDRVFGTTPALEASFSEIIEVPYHQITHMSDQQTFSEAAALPLCGITAFDCLKKNFALKKRQRILILGASGGVGTMATQISKYLVGPSGHVAAICSEKNHSFVSKLGADACFDYKNGLISLFSKLRNEYSSPENKFDLVFDAVSSMELKDQSFDYQKLIHKNGILKTKLNAPKKTKSNYISIGGKTLDWIRAGVKYKKFHWNWFNNSHELFWINFSNSNKTLKSLVQMIDQDKLKVKIEEIHVDGFKSIMPIRESFERLMERRVVGKIVFVL